MFNIIEGRPRQDVNLLKQWVSAIYACFDCSDFLATSYARTIHTLAKYTKGYINPDVDPLINALLAEWSQRAPIPQFDEQGIANSLWAFAVMNDPKKPLIEALYERACTLDLNQPPPIVML
ncbi:MAG: hypothetical protein CNLJKLNK_00354 [Holosporales bacterium]